MIDENEVKNIVFISPHLDDAILSCAGLISFLVEQGKKVEICNVFTSINDKNMELSEVVKEYIAEDLHENINNVNRKKCDEWIRLRQSEDEEACSLLKCCKRNLGYIDAIFRMKSEWYIYDTEEKLFAGKTINDEKLLKKELILKLSDICKDFDKCIFPMAVGNHVDHRIIYEVGLEIQKNNYNVSYYYEIPYSLIPSSLFTNVEKMDISKYLDLKINAVSKYTSQLQGLFGTKVITKEVIPNYEFYSI